MAARATWKGYLKVSLVNIPIRVFPATDSAASVSFNQLHGECQTRIQQKKWCPKCEREVPNAELVKGYEFEKGRYVVVSEEDIEKVRPASTRVIDLQQFAERDELDPIYFERPYYLAPDTQVAADAFAVIREGMAGKVGIGKVALYGREYLVAVEAREKGLVMYTLRQADEIRAMNEVSEYDLLPEKTKTAEVQLARQVISTFEKPLDLKQVQGRVPERAAPDHRRQGRRRGSDRDRGGDAVEGRRPHGGAPQEPGDGQRRQEEAGQGRDRGSQGRPRQEGRAEAQGRLAARVRARCARYAAFGRISCARSSAACTCATMFCRPTCSTNSACSRNAAG